METGLWNSLKDDLKDYAGIGLYRTSFTIPAEWKGKSVSLNLYGDRSPATFGDTEFFINGKKLDGASFGPDTKASGYGARIVIDGHLAGAVNVLAVKFKGGATLAKEPFNGFGGSVYLAAEKPLSPAVNLDESWVLNKQDGSLSAISLPISHAAGKFIAKEFEIPGSWAGRQIYLRIETETPWLTAAMVNGKLLLSAQFRKLGRFIEWNVTPWVQPGKNTRVELWGNALPLYNPYDPKKPPVETMMNLSSAKMGCVD